MARGDLAEKPEIIRSYKMYGGAQEAAGKIDSGKSDVLRVLRLMVQTVSWNPWVATESLPTKRELPIQFNELIKEVDGDQRRT